MRPKTPQVCSEPGCPELTDRGRCARHRTEAEQRRGSARERGYDAEWERRRQRFLAANPTCCECGQPATVADHAPLSRRQLIALGVADPDADERLQPRCKPCHDRRTAREQPGGWNQ